MLTKAVFVGTNSGKTVILWNYVTIIFWAFCSSKNPEKNVAEFPQKLFFLIDKIRKWLVIEHK